MTSDAVGGLPAAAAAPARSRAAPRSARPLRPAGCGRPRCGRTSPGMPISAEQHQRLAAQRLAEDERRAGVVAAIGRAVDVGLVRALAQEELHLAERLQFDARLGRCSRSYGRADDGVGRLGQRRAVAPVVAASSTSVGCDANGSRNAVDSRGRRTMSEAPTEMPSPAEQAGAVGALAGDEDLAQVLQRRAARSRASSASRRRRRASG